MSAGFVSGLRWGHRRLLPVLSDPGNCCGCRRSFGTAQASMGLFGSVAKFIKDRKKPVVSVINLHGTIMADGGGPKFGPKKINIENTRKVVDRVRPGGVW